MKKILFFVLMLFAVGASAQHINIYTDSGDEGFRIISSNTTDTIYVQKLTYITDFDRYESPPTPGIQLVNQFGGKVGGVYPADSMMIDSVSYSTFFELTAKLDSIFVNFNEGGRVGSNANVTDVEAGTYDVNNLDLILNVTYTATDTVTSLTITEAIEQSGRILVIKDGGGNATTNPITVDTEGTSKIDGSDTYLMDSDYDAINLYFDGTNWFVW